VTYAHRQNQLVIKYSKNPDKWLGWGWQLCEGDLIIDFDDGNDGRPISLSYRYEDGSGEEELKLGDDWVYRHKVADFDEINVRGRVKFSRLERPNQQALRNLLISEYGKCQVTGTKCTAALEACHIIPVRDRGNDDIGNALLLRRDIHSLFDAGLLWFQLTGDEWKVVISENVVEDDEYVGKLNGVVIARADDQCHRYLIQREKFDWGGKQV
jgi:hypothetical protein